MGDARLLDVAAGVRDLFRVDEDGALYLSRVTPDLLAPPVQGAALVRRPLRVAKAVPDVRVLRNDAQGHPLPAAADKDRYLARRGRVEPAQPLLDHWHRGVEVAQATRGCAELVTVLIVVFAEPA